MEIVGAMRKGCNEEIGGIMALEVLAGNSRRVAEQVPRAEEGRTTVLGDFRRKRGHGRLIGDSRMSALIRSLSVSMGHLLSAGWVMLAGDGLGESDACPAGGTGEGLGAAGEVDTVGLPIQKWGRFDGGLLK